MFVRVAGKQIRLREAGSDRPGAPIVLVHGAGASSLVWLSMLRRFGRHRRTLAVDLPGHGQSEPPNRYSLESYVAAVWDTLRVLGIDRCVLVGHSMGGAITASLATSLTGEVESLVQVTTGAQLEVDSAFLALLDESTARAMDRLVMRGFSPRTPRDLVRRFAAGLLNTPPEVIRHDFEICRQVDLRARLGEINCPTLIIQGEDDGLISASTVEQLARGIAGAQRLVIHAAGHLPFIEQEDAFVSAVHEFLGLG